MNLFEFRILNPATNLADIVLPDVETFTLAPSLSDVGTIQFTYPKNGVNYSQIINDRDLCVYYKGSEILSLRGTLEQNQGDDASLAEEGDLKTFTGRMSFSHFDRAIVYPSGWPTSTNPPTQAYSAVPIGQVLIDLIQKAQSRGAISNISWSFTATHDSNGVAWDNITISFNAQTSYLSCFQTMVNYGLCDLQMVGYRLDAYKFQTQGVDHTTVEPPLIMRRGRDMNQAQQQNSTLGLANIALVAGDNNTYVEVTNSPSVTSRGRREIGYSQNGVSDEGTLSAVGTALLQTVADEVKARTLQLNFADPNTPFPIDDFNIGDWVYVDVNDGTLTRQRVVQWSISTANDGLMTGTVALDNIFQEKINRINARLNALQNGVVIAGSSPPSPVPTIKYPPKVPTGLSIGSSTYQDNQGHTFAQADIVWTAVTQNTNNEAETELANYLVRHRLNPSGAWSADKVVQSGVTEAFESPFLPNVAYDFEVAAVDNQGNSSGWSAPVTITMSADTTAPNQPSTPTVASRLGQLSVVWDGLDSTAQPMPTDFDHVNVHVSAAGSSFTPSSTNLYGSMRIGQALQIPGAILTYNTQYWVKLIALDKTGNQSVASAAGTATLTQVVTTDLGSGQVGLSNISFSDVGNLVDNGSFEDANWRATRNTQFGGSHFGLDSTTASSGTWSMIHTGFAVGTEKVVIGTLSNVKIGQVFMGAADVKMDTSTTSAMFVSLGIDFLGATGALIQHSDLVTNWSGASTNDSIWRERITGTPATAPSGTVSANIVVSSTSHTAGNVWFDNLEVRMQIDTLLVADAAITDAKINSLSANKITAGTINAGIVLAGTIETATTGGRVVVDGPTDTIYIYDSSGVNIGQFGVNGLSLFTTGSASLVVDHAPGASQSPIMKFVANSGSPPPTPAQIYANYAVGASPTYEGIIVKSPIESDGSWARMLLTSGSSGGQIASGALLYSNPSASLSEQIMLSWGGGVSGGGLTGAQLNAAGTGTISGSVMISTGPKLMAVYENTTVSVSAGVAHLIITGAGWNVTGGVFCCGGGSTTQIQLIAITNSSGTTDIEIHIFTAAGAPYNGNTAVWGLIWG